jgi:hypothetical protein
LNVVEVPAVSCLRQRKSSTAFTDGDEIKPARRAVGIELTLDNEILQNAFPGVLVV